MFAPGELISIENRGQVAIVHLNRDITRQSPVSDLPEDLRGLARKNERIVLDFKDVDYINSDVLGMLYGLSREVRDRDGQLRLCNVCALVREVLSFTKFDEFLDTDDTLEDSLTRIT